MANTHTKIEAETEVTITLKVKFTQASYYGEKSAEELQDAIEIAKNNIKPQLLYLLQDEYCNQELCQGIYFDYEVANF